jgi:ribosomal protein L11 methyltransferase
LDWLELSVTTNAEVAEAVVELFNRKGPGRAVVETPVDCFEHELGQSPAPVDVIVKTYLPLDGTAETVQRQIEEGLWHLGQVCPIPELVVRRLAEEDWTEAWKQQYHRLHVGQRTVIVPAWEAYAPAPDQVVIYLEPGMAFGTGLHPTTRLCLEALEVHLVAGSRVLDVGTGSGILSIAAAKLGAESVLALDTDPVAVTVAQENAALNKVAGRVSLHYGTLGRTGGHGWGLAPSNKDWGLAPSNKDNGQVMLETGQFGLVLVNILAPVIIAMGPALAARLAPSGRLITAGLVDHQEEKVRRSLASEGLQIIERAQEEDWVCLVAQRG